MEPTHLTLNNKFDIIFSMIAQFMQTQEKQLPMSLRMSYKPMLNIMRSFLIIMPEDELSAHIQHAQHMIEALQCNHATIDDFENHVRELVLSWT